ncbi:calcium-binding protein, partial [Endozoicomonas acroporae]|uniref:calcium-binding protein n=1 Tax=Endozoicomonas acroporae TaxID=1701104 RepID=UPI003D7B962C
GAGNDTYVIAKGDGQDIITENRSGSDTDRILLGGGILPEHTSVHRHGQHLLITTDGDSQSIRVNNYFNSDAATNYAVDTIEFADGTQWDIETIKGKVIVPTESNDEIWGYGSDDTLSGLAGDDVIRAQSGNDSVDAGAGKDTVYGGDGQDALVGASGADRLYGENGDDQLVGDEGVDQLYGGSGNDSLDGGSGDDHLYGDSGNDQLAGGEG